MAATVSSAVAPGDYGVAGATQQMGRQILDLFRNLAVNVGQQVRSFLVEAGTVILSLTIILWVLLSYPRLAETTEVFATRQAEARRSPSGSKRPTRAPRAPLRTGAIDRMLTSG